MLNPSHSPHRSLQVWLAIIFLMVVALTVSRTAGQQRASDVASTKHNLTATGPGAIRVGSGSEPCQFCHTPHAASPRAPLWNREDPGTHYEPYASSTLAADVGQPTGASRLCLSCHDGTIALAQTINPRNVSGGTVYLSEGDRGFIGTDLRDDHPISFIYDSALTAQKAGLRDPSTLPAHLPLDDQSRVQCTTCHDPHDDRFGQFLRMDNRFSQMCASCHHPDGYATSAHALSNAPLNAAQTDTWDNLNVDTVQEAACGSCHRPHTAGGRERLLRHEPEEMNCLNCHDGTVASTDIATLIDRFSAHNPRLYTGEHDPTENATTMNKHVECADCHNPHLASGTGSASAPDIKPTMRGARGMTGSGQALDAARYEYEVCYQCHAQQNFATATIERVEGGDDIARQFAPGNASYHPVEAIGRSADVPSLIAPWTTTDRVYCTDCHASDDDQGPRGPHGSRFAPLLAANYSTTLPTVEGPQAYALCYSCHDRGSILANESFAGHQLHVANNHAPCSTCHTAHGSQTGTHLINFDRSVVEPSQAAQTGPTFTDLGAQRGSCTLSCHGKDHVNLTYE